MHTVGGGASIRGFEFLLRLHEHFHARDRFPQAFYDEVDQYFMAWYAYTPKEFARRTRSIVTDRKDLKMREAHEATVYHSVALLAVAEIRDQIFIKTAAEEGEDEDEEVYAKAYMGFVYAMHLIGQTTHESPSNKDINLADKLLRNYVRTYSSLSERFLYYKNHCLIHLAGEARAYGSHLGGFDAYVYENFLGKFRNNNLIKSGREVLTQVYNRLCSRAAYPSPRDPLTGKLLKVAPSLDAEAEAMKEIGSMDLPPNTVRWEKLTNQEGGPLAKQSVMCEGFCITNR